jgi:hypothetical protein
MSLGDLNDDSAPSVAVQLEDEWLDVRHVVQHVVADNQVRCAGLIGHVRPPTADSAERDSGRSGSARKVLQHRLMGVDCADACSARRQRK